jgi:hypothetical protein
MKRAEEMSPHFSVSNKITAPPLEIQDHVENLTCQTTFIEELNLVILPKQSSEDASMAASEHKLSKTIKRETKTSVSSLLSSLTKANS